jgi:hypothetical protein
VHCGIGYETLVEMQVNEGDQTIHWQERRLIIQSIDASLAAQASLQERLEKAEQAIGELMVRKQGKPRLTSRSQGEEQLQSILSSLRVEGLLQVHIQEEIAEQPVRAYRGKLSSPRQIWSWKLHVERNQEAIERAMKLLGWRVYATNQQTVALGLARAVEAYRDEYLVERNFGRLKGHPLSLGPLYVQRDDHRVGLMRLLTIALRVVTVLEGRGAFRSGGAVPEDCRSVCGQPQTPDGSAYHRAVAGSLQRDHSDHRVWLGVCPTASPSSFCTATADFSPLWLFSCRLYSINR